jgi:hypothetical protein
VATGLWARAGFACDVVVLGAGALLVGRGLDEWGGRRIRLAGLADHSWGSTAAGPSDLSESTICVVTGSGGELKVTLPPT